MSAEYVVTWSSRAKTAPPHARRSITPRTPRACMPILKRLDAK